MTDNVVSMPTPLSKLAEQLRADVAFIESARDHWVEGMLRLAEHLREARNRHPSNIDFGVWLEREQIRIGQNDRAALIAMGDQPELFRQILIEQTDPLHADTIWRKYQNRFGKLPKTEQNSPPVPEPHVMPIPATKSEEPPPAKSQDRSDYSESKMSERCGFAKAPRAKEIYEIFQAKETRGALGRIWQGRNKRAIWSLITTAMDAGLLTRNNRTPNAASMLMLFPEAPIGFVRQYDLQNPKHLARVKDIVLPAMIACRDKIRANPEQMQDILTEYTKAQKATAATAIAQQQRSTAIATMPADQQELIFHGAMVWPCPENGQGQYDYDQIRAAIWTFKDLLAWNKITTDNSPGSIALRMRLSVKWYSEYLLRMKDRENPMLRIFNLVQWLSRLYQAAPEAECKWPMYPHIECQW